MRSASRSHRRYGPAKVGLRITDSKSWAGNTTNVSIEILDKLDLVHRSKDFGKVGSCEMNYNVQITSLQPITA